MRDYWNNLALRERQLLGTLGAVAFFVCVFFLGVRPILNAKDNAIRAQEFAQRDLQTVQKGIPYLTGGTSTSSGGQPFNRNAVMQMVQSNGLEMSRIQPENNGALKLWFEDASSPKVFKFISDTTTRYAAVVTSVQMTRKNNGLINVTLTLRPAGA